MNSNALPDITDHQELPRVRLKIHVKSAIASNLFAQIKNHVPEEFRQFYDTVAEDISREEFDALKARALEILCQ